MINRYLIITMKGDICMALSEQRKEYLYEYQKNKLKRIPLDVPKEKYDEIKAAADAVGEKVNGYIKKAIDERIERENTSIQNIHLNTITMKGSVYYATSISTTAGNNHSGAI